jgi:hypothetical protein
MRTWLLVLGLAVVAPAAAEDIRGALYNPLGAAIPGARVLLMESSRSSVSSLRSTSCRRRSRCSR